ncbi:MAG: peptidylprolyl isomerase [Bacteroidales bacterium]|nr:peptidylprolyl isomerase [Bacteroidales bacterium]
MKAKYLLVSAAVAAVAAITVAQNNIAEEVAWTIGDDPIYKSEIEQTYRDMQQDREAINGDPYCVIPEMMAIQRLYLHQADIDTVVVQDSQVQLQVDQQLNFLINNLGSREKVEQYFRKTIPEIREYYANSIRDRQRVHMVQQNLTKDVKATPSEVRKYFDNLPKDSIPYVPGQVEVQIITVNPVIPRQEIDDVKARLRDMADRVNRGEADFSTLAILYSEAPEGVRGGELGFLGRGQLVPEYAAVAFNLNDPKKVSKIVETEFGFHIIQLIEKRGDRINTRHILLRPKVSDKDLQDAITRLDSLRSDIVDKGRVTFEDAARLVSQDKDTRYSNGVMVNQNTGTTRFQMSELPQEVAREVANLKPGEVSKPFIMKQPKRDRDIVAIVRLTNRIDAHSANLSDDYQQIKNMYEAAKKQQILDQWLERKISETYVRIEDGWRGCDFQHKGWIKARKGQVENAEEAEKNKEGEAE